MEPGFTKIFESLLDSTVWQESKETKLVWVTMMLMKNKLHVVQASVPGLAKRAGVTVEECEEALAVFKKPDPYSRTRDYGGRRIEDVPGGWKLLNGEVYKQRMGPDERRAYQAAWQKEYRKRKKETKHDGACDGAQQAIQDGLAEDKAKMERDNALAQSEPPPPEPEPPRCRALPGQDCMWGQCPQAIDGEPAATGRDCPLATKWEAWAERNFGKGNSPL